MPEFEFSRFGFASASPRAGRGCFAAVFAACAGLAGPGAGAALAVERPETEPNNTKAQADLNGSILLNPFDAVTGVTTGSSTTTTGIASADYFRIRTAAQPLGIYRHAMQLATVGGSGHIVSIRGLTQSAGVITTTSDPIAQTGSSLTVPARTVAWYGFGRQEEVYYRVHGLPATTGVYIATLNDSLVVPITVPDLLFAGVVRISATATGTSTIDTDTWLYDAALNAIPGGGNDDVFGSPAGGPSSLMRTLVPGEYTLAIAPAQLSNNQPSPPDDDVRNGTVLDFPGAVLGSIVNANGNSQTGQVHVTIDDFVHPPTVVPVFFLAGTTGEVKFIRFTLVADPTPSGACCLVGGACVIASAPGCAAQSGVYQGDAVACTGVSCPAQGSCCDRGGCCTITLQAVCTGGGLWTSGGVCIPNTCPAPLNDLCAGAIPLMPGIPVTGGNCTATSSNDGPAAGCQSSAGKAVWYQFTPPVVGTYQFSACGSLQDTVLTIFTTVGCTTFTEVNCDDDGCDGTNPPGSGLASISRVLTLSSTVTYLVRLSSFGTAPAGGPFNLVVNPVASGACCAFITGECTIGVNGVCTGGLYQGDGSLCLPSPCPPAGACCRGSCCATTIQSACSGWWSQAAACSSNPCPLPGNDLCAGAIPIMRGTPTLGDNCAATSTNDGPAAACQSLAAKAVWYLFVPTHTASYRVSMCGSLQDTVLQVLTSPDCLLFTPVPGGCDDDACDGVNPPGSTLASQIAAVPLTVGVPYLIRVSSFGATPAGGAFTLLVTANNTLGACCAATGTCTPVDGPSCPVASAFTPDAACLPNPCSVPTGACCRGTTCAATAPSECSGPNQFFSGTGTVCNAPGNLTSPCCLADFNHAGGASVQDIFDFLAAYFAGDPFADINGGGISVQDIFDFLAAYFAGCA